MGESTAARLTISGLRPKVVSTKEMQPKQGIENAQEMRQRGKEMAKQKRGMKGGKLNGGIAGGDDGCMNSVAQHS